jgi:hypothetical protein
MTTINGTGYVVGSISFFFFFFFFLLEGMS